MGKKLTNEEFLAKVYDTNEHMRNGEIEILSEYAGRHNPVTARCLIHDELWSPTPGNLYQGYGCKKCGDDRGAEKRRMTDGTFLNVVMQNNIHVQNGTMAVTGQFKGTREPIECMCFIHNYHWNPRASKVILGQGCPYCGHDSVAQKHTKPYNQVAQEIIDAGIDVRIIGEYINEYTPTDCSCSFGHIWKDKIINVLQGHGCPYCSNSQVLVGFNDVWTTHPGIAQLLANPEDGYKYTYGSTHKTDFTCPICGEIIHKSFNYVSYHGLSCSNCSDGISYPNKFIRHLLKQLGVNFIPEYSPEWAQSKKYDCYFMFNQKQYIVEMNGLQHYEESSLTKLSLQQIMDNDKLKTMLATKHGIEVIHIDCRKSECEYIRQNIMLSPLSSMFDLSGVDWQQCDMNSRNSLVKIACDLYASGIHSTTKIGALVGVDRNTISRYLKRGTEFGWCDYRPNLRKVVELLDDKMNVVQCFDNVDICNYYLQQVYNIKTSKSSIYAACKNNVPYKGVNLRYADYNTKLM